jgi:3-oxoacyl-[acyl-carrier-protein] synthase-1
VWRYPHYTQQRRAAYTNILVYQYPIAAGFIFLRLSITHYTATSAAGIGLSKLRTSLVRRQSGLRQNDFPRCDLNTWIGRVPGVESVELPMICADLHSRNNQLAWLGLQQDGLLDAIAALAQRLGPKRIGVVMGSSTSSIGRTEEAYTQLEDSGRMPLAYRQPGVHNLHSLGIFVAAATGLEGPAITLSTACSSSAKVFATAARWIEHGIVDAAIVGGVDSLCLNVLYGFNSLELISDTPCRPFDRARKGINIGEGAGYALLTASALEPDAPLQLCGYGESSDAYHMSHPHPEGKGAIIAMTRALERAECSPADIDYINLHGTASKANDQVETLALAEVFTPSTLAGSTKAWTGHALGAAGILEAVIAMDTLKTGTIPGTLNCENLDPNFCFPILQDNVEKNVRFSMTNSFGFGGNNAALVFGHNNG